MHAWTGQNDKTKKNEFSLLSSEGIKESEKIPKCEQCGKEISQEQYDDYDGLCEECFEAQDYEYETG
jgi:hypothetical protein